MWQTKYASAVPKNLGLGFNFWPCSEGYFPLWVSIVRAIYHSHFPIDTLPMFGMLVE